MRLGRLWAGFWRPQNSILEPPGLDFGASSLNFEASRLDCGASRPPTFLCVCFPHSATPLGKRGTVSCLGFIPFVFLPSSTALPKCGRRRCPPLGAFNKYQIFCKSIDAFADPKSNFHLDFISSPISIFELLIFYYIHPSTRLRITGTGNQNPNFTKNSLFPQFAMFGF